jgi:hypothetical protein
LHGVDQQAYLTDALTKLVNLWPASRLDESLAGAADGNARRMLGLPLRALAWRIRSRSETPALSVTGPSRSAARRGAKKDTSCGLFALVPAAFVYHQ